VLPFRIDFINTVKQKSGVDEKQVKAIDIEKAMGAPERIRKIVAYILEHFDRKTYRKMNRSAYLHRSITNVQAVAGDKSRQTEEVKKRAELTDSTRFLRCRLSRWQKSITRNLNLPKKTET